MMTFAAARNRRPRELDEDRGRLTTRIERASADHEAEIGRRCRHEPVTVHRPQHIAVRNENHRSVEPTPRDIPRSPRRPAQVVPDEYRACFAVHDCLADGLLVRVGDQIERGCRQERGRDQGTGRTRVSEGLAEDSCFHQSCAAAPEFDGNKDSRKAGLSERGAEARPSRVVDGTSRSGDLGLQDLAC